MARNADPIKFHPMLMRIIDAHARGEPATDIAKWVFPKVSSQVISKYIRENIKPAMKTASRIIEAEYTKEAQNASNRAQPASLPQSNSITIDLKTVPMATLVGKRSLAIRENRVALQADLVRRLSVVVDERAAEMSACAVCGRAEELHPIGDDMGNRCDVFVRISGGASGLLARDIKGPNDTPVYKFDAALAGEFRELMKHTAIELGQWNENTGGNVSIQVLCPIAPNADNAPRIVIGAEGTIEAEEGSYEDIGVIQGR